jgi:hypothetical protein
MNKRSRFAVFAAALLTAGALAPNVRAQAGKMPMHGAEPGAAPALAPPPARAGASAQDKKTSAGESFFIVASVDQSKSQFLLKRPTEVTLLVKVDANTRYLDDAGQPLKSSDFRAGDTIWLTSSGRDDNSTALRIRKGQMTVPDLHRYYLDYPEIK